MSARPTIAIIAGMVGAVLVSLLGCASSEPLVVAPAAIDREPTVDTVAPRAVGEEFWREDCSALHRAVGDGDLDLCARLLQSGESPDAICGPCEESALHEAARTGNVAIVRLLLSHGANSESRAYDGIRPLHVAAGLGHPDMVLLLLDAGAHPNRADQEGVTPLDWAIVNGHDSTAELLRSRGGEGGAWRPMYERTPGE